MPVAVTAVKVSRALSTPTLPTAKDAVTAVIGTVTPLATSVSPIAKVADTPLIFSTFISGDTVPIVPLAEIPDMPTATLCSTDAIVPVADTLKASCCISA